MTLVCSTWLFVSKQAFDIGNAGYGVGVVCLGVALIWFGIWHKKEFGNKNK